MKSLREYGFTIALLVTTLVVAFFPILFHGRTLLPSDLIDTMMLPFSQHYGPQHAYNSLITDGYFQFYPLKYFTQQAYRDGFFAFWNPYILNGYPQYLEGMWTYNFALVFPFAIAFPLLLLSPLLVAGIGMYALLRDCEVRPGVARIFATAYMMNALFITHLLAHFIPASFSFAPFVLLFLHRYERNPKFKFLTYSSIALALGFFAGNIQTIGFLVFLTACYWVSLWFLHSPRPFGSFIRPLSITLGFAIGLSAILLLPTLELLQETRSGGSFFSTSLLRSYDLVQRIESFFLAFTFFLPQLAGSVRGVMLHQAIGVFTIDFQGAIGFLPLLIAVWASITLWKQRSIIRPFVVLMIVGFALPVATPLFHFIYHRFFIIFILGSCGAGAIGLEAILASDKWNASLQTWTKGFAYGLLGIVVMLSAFSFLRAVDFSLIEHIARTQVLPRLRSAVFAEGNARWIRERFADALDYWRLTRPELLAGIVLSFISLAILWWKKLFRSRSLQIAVWLVTVAQLILFIRLWFPMLDPAQYPLYPETQETQLLQDSGAHDRTYVYREVDTARQFAFINNENVVYGIPEVTGFESIIPRCLYIYIAILHKKDSGFITPKFLGKFDVGTLARATSLPFDSLALESSGPLWIYHNPSVYPRAYLAHEADVLPDDTAVLRRMSVNSSPWPVAYFTPEEHAKNMHTSPAASDSVAIEHASENEINMSTNSRDSSYLMLTDTYYPGWNASIDGSETRVLRSNYAMRAIALPPGAHRVTFSFRPNSFCIGAWISLSSFLLLLGICIANGQKRERSPY